MIEKAFLSMGSAIFWFLVFAAACAAGTFIESAYDTPTAWALVYGTAWFALIHLILGINLAYNIFAYRLINAKKIPVLIFHVGFLFILVGAAITRYAGVEGLMHIRNGGSSNEISTSLSYIQLRSIDENGSMTVAKPMYLSRTGSNDFKLKSKVAGKEATLTYTGFMENADYKWVKSDANDAKAVIEIVFSDKKNTKEVALVPGTNIEVGDMSITFDAQAKTPKYISFFMEDGKFYISSNYGLTHRKMTDMTNPGANAAQPLENDKKYEISEFSVFTLMAGDETIHFSVKSMLEKAEHKLVKLEQKGMGADALQAVLEYNGKKENMDIFVNDRPTQIVLDDAIFEASFNPMKIELPFKISLERFEMLRYAGSSSPMSYSSFIHVEDNKTGTYPYHIYMNHVLDHGGYRFFQSSYDKDEQGTILSVNKDPGKIPTYIGYFLLGLGFLLNIINPNSRFGKLTRLVAEQNLKYTSKVAIIAFLALLGWNSNLNAADISKLPQISKEHANIAKTMIIQSNDGRMKPFDTLANELLNKLYRSSTFAGMDANEVLLSMVIAPGVWRSVPIIKVSDERLRNILGLNSGDKYASFDDFFVVDGNKSDYKLLKASEEANRKALSARTTFDKEVVKADEKVNILYMILSTEILRIIPLKDDPNNTWYSIGGALIGDSGFDDAQRAEVEKLAKAYFDSTIAGVEKNDWQEANKNMEAIKAYQAKNGANIMPNESHINAELTFNKYKVFSNLVGVYLIAGFALLIVVFVRLATTLRLNMIFKIVYIVNILAFVAHTFALGLRWYISGHAPWSDSYESLVYIAWALALSGIVFSRRSAISLALTAIMAGCVLFVAHLSWIDPQITNLQPVLRSYWLTIHVSVITASYGFLGLCSLLGIFVLILFIMQGKIENPRLSANILEATRINEMAMILGLSLLTLGNFLGGVWANESWGRYWGWDSKETWALISILVYAAVLHMRFVPRINTQFAFAVASMFAYWAIVFTYFGVNFYLTGMHSYAAGDAVQVPMFVYVIVIVMFALWILAGIRGKKYDKRL